MGESFRNIQAYKDYFSEFVSKQSKAVKEKVYWTLNLIETIPRISENYLKKLDGTDGLFEIRIQFGSNIYRIFCFFDEGKLIILLNGFNKKTQKTPKREIEKALRLRDEYYEEKS